MFKDRCDAGHRLGKKLLRYKDRHPLVLALPRGGVPIAYEVARILDSPFDVLLVRKIGVSRDPECVVGAIVDGSPPQLVGIGRAGARPGGDSDELRRETERQLGEIERRRRLYLGDRPHAQVKGRVVIVVDDGINTGATMRAAIRGLRRQSPARIVLAVPVAGSDALEDLSGEVDDMVCLISSPQIEALSHYYEDFHQIHDNQVADLLRQAEQGHGSAQGRHAITSSRGLQPERRLRLEKAELFQAQKT